MATFILNIAKPLFGKDERSLVLSTLPASQYQEILSISRIYTLYLPLFPNLIELARQLD